MPLGGGPGRGTGAVDAEARSSANVGALQDGQCPPSGTAPPQCGQLTGTRPFVTRGTSETLGNKRRAYATARGSSIYLRPDRGKCSGDLEDQDGSPDLDLVARGQERVGDRPAIDEDVPALAQALEPPGRALHVGDERGVLAGHALVVDQDRTSRGIAAE